MAGSDNNGTEAATPRRREAARDEGDVVFSSDLTASVALLAGLLILLWFGPAISTRFMDSFRLWITDVPLHEWGTRDVTAGAHWLTWEMLSLSGVMVGGLMSIGLAFGFAQVGFHISFDLLAIKWERVLPENGFSKIISMDSGIHGLMNVAKVTFLMTVSGTLLWLKRSQLSIHNFATVEDVASFAWKFGMSLCLAMAGVCVGLALVDYLIKWFRHEQKLMMTREEIKQEQKDDSGDPHVRAAIRRKQREARKQQSVKDVPKATVILTNPTHLAIAIQYEPGKMKAPKIVAKGAGVFAKNIVKIARENKIPVLERKPLARALYKNVQVGQEVPVDFFRAIAEILAQIYKARQSAA